MTVAHAILHDRYPHLVPEHFDFECADGWIQLLEDFLAVVDRELAAGGTFELRQVKEKMGGLRLYYDLGKMLPEAERAIQDASDRAEARSHSICEECGKRGHLSSRSGHLMTLCDFHADIGEVKAVLVEQGPYLIGGANGWLRYDFELDAFVDVEPPKSS